MKTLKSLLYVFLAAFLFVGCNDDENFNPGEPEDPDCYSVYFPTQENIGSKELDPAAPTEMTFTVRRLKSEGAIVVPVAVTSSEEGIFVPSQIEFADGQEETTFSIQFPQAEIGTTYKCEVNIEDKKYASVYGEKATGFAFSVTRVKWNKLTGKGGETKGKWRDDIISTLFNTANPNAEVDVEIYERADKPGYYRMNPFTQDLIRALFNGTAQACTEPNIIIDATNPDAVWIPYQTTGVTLGGDGEIEIASKVNANFSSVSESASLYGTLKDGIITFPATGIMVNFTVSGGWYGANGSGLQRIMLPGAKAYDYTLALTNTEPAAGVVKVGFKFGADVAKVKYAFFNGSMSDALADVRSGEIESGETPSTEITASGTVSASFDDTGVYSIVGNMYNTAGELVGRSFLSFGYVKSGEESQNAVILSVRTELSWEKEALGYTPENSIKAILFGQNIQSGYWGLFKTSDLAGLSTAQLGQVAKSSGDAFTEEELAKINGKESLVPFLVGLNSGTSYTLLAMPTCHIGMFKTYHVGNMFTYEENPTGINGSQGCLYAGYVDDGILAFVPNPNYVTQGYTFKGIYWGGFGNYDPTTGKFMNLAADLVQFDYLMLINPANDPNAVTAAAVARELEVRPANNFVELRGPELIQVLWSEQTGKPVNRATFGGYGMQPDLGVADAVATFSEGSMPQAPGAIVMIGKKVSLK